MPFDQSKPYTLDRVVRIAITLAIFYGLILLMDSLSSVLVPFVLSLLIAYLIFPLVRFFEQKVFKNRLMATITSLLSLLVGIIGILMITIPIIGSQITKMGQLLRNLVTQNTGGNLPDSLASVEKFLVSFAEREDVQELFNFQNIETALEKLLPGLYGGLYGIFSGSMSILVGLFGITIIIFYIIFILIDFEEITGGWRELIPFSYRDRVVRLLDDLKDGMATYFRAQSLIVMIISLLFAVGFSIIGLPMGFLLGVFIGILNYVPYLQNIGFIPATFLAAMHALETGDSFWGMMGLVALVFGIVQLIQDAFLTPKIMGDATGLNPAMILLSLTIWGQILGMLGLLIALPVTSILISYYRRFLKQTERQNSKIIIAPHLLDDDDDDDDDEEEDEPKKGKIILFD